MRVKITLRCNECKQRNYNTMKNKKNRILRIIKTKWHRKNRFLILTKISAYPKWFWIWVRTVVSDAVAENAVPPKQI